MAQVVNVAIIGCGLIGTQWDAAAPAAAFSLTHAAAFAKHPAARLAALCDRDPDKAAQAALRWGAARAYSDPRRLFAENAIDLAVVAASSAARWEVVEPALAAGVKVLVIEKPLATTLAESRRLVAAMDAAGAKSLVNFSRHWDPSMRDLREAIRAGELGRIQRLVGTYGKGLTNNGSHMIDLAATLCDARPLRARALGSPLDAGEAAWSDGRDGAPDAQVEFVDGAGALFHLTMLGTDQRAFTCFELRVVGSAAVCELSQGGRRLTLAPVRADPNYAGYTILGEAASLPARALEAMERMADEALQLAQGRIAGASCDAHTALRTALAVAAVGRSAEQDGRWVALDELEQADQADDGAAGA
jgi:predicted dehydrogenase